MKSYEIAVEFLQAVHQIRREQIDLYVGLSQRKDASSSDDLVRIEHAYHDPSDLPLYQAFGTGNLGVVAVRARLKGRVDGRPGESKALTLAF